MTERRRWLVLLLLPPLFWAGNALVGRAVVGEIEPLALSFWRWIAALVLILPFTARSLATHLPILAANWRVVVPMGLLSVAAYNTLLYQALQTTTAINATLVGTSLPLVVVLLGRIWLKEPIRARQAAGIAVSACGLLTVVAKGDPSLLARLEFAPGDLLMLVATLSWSLYSVMLRKYPLPVPGFTLLAALIAVGVTAILPLHLWASVGAQSLALSAKALAAVGYTATFASLAAYYFWNRGVAAVGAAVAGQFTYLIPLFTAILAVALLGEEFHWFHAVGGGLIFAGIALATSSKRAASD